MATFVSTTLDKRTGSTTTTFSPLGKTGDSGTLAASGTFTGVAPTLVISSKGGVNRPRVAKCRITVPQIEDQGLDYPIVKSRPYIETVLVVPAGTLQTDVNDLVGYMNDALSTGTTNLNALFVTGEGVW